MGGDLSAVWGGKGSPVKALLRHPVGKLNEHVCCSRVTVTTVDLHMSSHASHGSSYSTIPYGGPSRRLMRYSFD